MGSSPPRNSEAGPFASTRQSSCASPTSGPTTPNSAETGGESGSLSDQTKEDLKPPPTVAETHVIGPSRKLTRSLGVISRGTWVPASECLRFPPRWISHFRVTPPGQAPKRKALMEIDDDPPKRRRLQPPKRCPIHPPAEVWPIFRAIREQEGPAADQH